MNFFGGGFYEDEILNKKRTQKGRLTVEAKEKNTTVTIEIGVKIETEYE